MADSEIIKWRMGAIGTISLIGARMMSLLSRKREGAATARLPGGAAGSAKTR